MGSLPMYGKSSHIWEVFPYMESKSCMVTNIFGDQQHAFQGLCRGQGQARGRPTGGTQGSAEGQPGYTPHAMGLHPRICGKSSHAWEAFPYMRSLPTYKKTSHIRGDSPYRGSLPIYGINPGRKAEVRFFF
jgi:hypothetical protein